MSLLAALIVHGEPCLDGLTHVTFERSAPWPPDEIALIEGIMGAFLAAGARSAYACPRASPGSSNVTLAGPPMAVGANLDFSLNTVQVDARAFQLLRHMASMLEPAGDEALKRITVACVAQPQTAPRVAFPVIDWDDEDDQYPGVEPTPPFAVGLDGTVPYSKFRRLLVEFANAPDRPTLDELEVYAVEWGRLLEGGAFALPCGLPDVMDSVMGPVSQFDRFTAEIEVPVYQASELGFDVLLQMLSTFHLRVRPIQLVTIE